MGWLILPCACVNRTKKRKLEGSGCWEPKLHAKTNEPSGVHRPVQLVKEQQKWGKTRLFGLFVDVQKVVMGQPDLLAQQLLLIAQGVSVRSTRCVHQKEGEVGNQVSAK